TVVAAHWMASDASARWRSFCGIMRSSTSRPFFLKMPALSASVSGAKPVQPDMPRAILVSCALAFAAMPAAQAAAAISEAILPTDVTIKVLLLRFKGVRPAGRRRTGFQQRAEF